MTNSAAPAPDHVRDLDGLLTDVLGEHTVVADRSRPHGNRVLEVTDAAGWRWVAKRPRFRAGWEREVRAYRQWTPALGPHAPQLCAADRTRRALVTSFVHGEPAADEPRTHRAAGALLRRLHRSDPRLRADGLADNRRRQLDQMLRTARDALGRRELAFVRGEIAATDTVTPPLVPCTATTPLATG